MFAYYSQQWWYCQEPEYIASLWPPESPTDSPARVSKSGLCDEDEYGAVAKPAYYDSLISSDISSAISSIVDDDVFLANLSASEGE